jgi:hypothetical protein
MHRDEPRELSQAEQYTDSICTQIVAPGCTNSFIKQTNKIEILSENIEMLLLIICIVI